MVIVAMLYVSSLFSLSALRGKKRWVILPQGFLVLGSKSRLFNSFVPLFTGDRCLHGVSLLALSAVWYELFYRS